MAVALGHKCRTPRRRDRISKQTYDPKVLRSRHADFDKSRALDIVSVLSVSRPVPSPLEIAWVAGIYEGEGSCGPKVGGKGSLRVAIVQKDTWILLKIQGLYGGGVYKRRTLFKGKWYDGHVLQLSAGPTRAMLSDILPFLSPWRQAQARTALELRPPRPRATAERCIHGHPLVGVWCSRVTARVAFLPSLQARGGEAPLPRERGETRSLAEATQDPTRGHA